MNSKQNLSQLVSELSKQKPDLVLVKAMCQKAGFNYSTDLIQLMSDILMNVTRPILDHKSNEKLNQKDKKNKNKPHDSARI